MCELKYLHISPNIELGYPLMPLPSSSNKSAEPDYSEPH